MTRLVLVMIVLILGFILQQSSLNPLSCAGCLILENNLVNLSYEDLSEHPEENRGKPSATGAKSRANQGVVPC